MERLNNETLKNAISVYETTVKEIEEYGIDDPDYCPALDKSTLSFLKELKEYRDAEEQGLLIKLPCKVGTDVYVLTHYFLFGELGDKPERHYRIETDKFTLNMSGYFGKTVFLTKEEAEKALEEMEK